MRRSGFRVSGAQRHSEHLLQILPISCRLWGEKWGEF
nr:MAG TPA: hypothetical protein [Caudoviricetes sp.]